MIGKFFSSLFRRNQRSRRPSSFSSFTREALTGSKYKIGEYTYGLPCVKQWGEETNLNIGKFCSIAENVTILLGGNHRTDWISTYPFNAFNDVFPGAASINGHPSSKGDVNIGNDVWLGMNVLIMSGITISDGAVIAAGSVVTKNVGPYEIWGGNPCKFIRKRFDEETIQSLLKLRWWDWDHSEIQKAAQVLCSSEIGSLISRKQLDKDV